MHLASPAQQLLMQCLCVQMAPAGDGNGASQMIVAARSMRGADVERGRLEVEAGLQRIVDAHRAWELSAGSTAPPARSHERFRPRRVLGHGGVVSVQQAWRTVMLGVEVPGVLKTVDLSRSSVHRGVRAWGAEASVGTAFTHPNVAVVCAFTLEPVKVTVWRHLRARAPGAGTETDERAKELVDVEWSDATSNLAWARMPELVWGKVVHYKYTIPTAADLAAEGVQPPTIFASWRFKFFMPEYAGAGLRDCSPMPGHGCRALRTLVLLAGRRPGHVHLTAMQVALLT